MRIMVSKPHLIKDNPLLKDLEDIGRKDPKYFHIIHAIKTGSPTNPFLLTLKSGGWEGNGGGWQ